MGILLQYAGVRAPFCVAFRQNFHVVQGLRGHIAAERTSTKPNNKYSRQAMIPETATHNSNTRKLHDLRSLRPSKHLVDMTKPVFPTRRGGWGSRATRSQRT